jgi:hypothetical protein
VRTGFHAHSQHQQQPLVYIQTICVINKEKNLVTLWSLDKFEHRLSILRDIYDHFLEEKEDQDNSYDCNSSSTSSSSNYLFNSNEYKLFIESSEKEWQTLESFMQNDEQFSSHM